METIKSALTASMARGVLWVLATMAAQSGISSANNESTARAVAEFVVSAAIGIATLWWSKKSAVKLLNTTPPAK